MKRPEQTSFPQTNDATTDDVFPFFSLPLELRLHIYSYIIPTNEEFYIRPTVSIPAHKSDGTGIDFGTFYKSKPALVASQCCQLVTPSQSSNGFGGSESGGIGSASTEPVSRTPSGSLAAMPRHITALFLLCRQIYEEASDLLYGLNTFTFVVTRSDFRACPNNYAWRNGPTIWINSALSVEPSVLQKLRRVHFDIIAGKAGATRFNDARNGLEKVVKIWNGFDRKGDKSDVLGPGQSQSHRLETLTIDVQLKKHLQPWFDRGGSSSRWYWSHLQKHPRCGQNGVDDYLCDICRAVVDKAINKFTYAIEPFSNLRGLKEARISGKIDTEFARKLESVMLRNKDDSEELPIVEYGNTTMLRRPPGASRRRSFVISEKQWNDPVYDWTAVELPKNTHPDNDLEVAEVSVTGETCGKRIGLVEMRVPSKKRRLVE
jgi:hypothetical protein